MTIKTYIRTTKNNGDVILSNILDSITGKLIELKKVSHFVDGSPMDNTKLSRKFRKLVTPEFGVEYFKVVIDGHTPFSFYGVKSDGITDDTAAVQYAINDMFKSGGGTLIFNAGTTVINGSISVKRGVDIIGVGRNSIIETNYDGVLFDIDKVRLPTDVIGSGGLLSSFSILKKNNNYIGTAVRMRNFTRGLISQLFIKGFEKAIDTSGSSWSSTISNNYLNDNIYGIYLYGTDEDGNDPAITGKTMVYTGLNGGSIKNNEIQGNYYGVYFEAFAIFNRYHNHGVWISENQIEGNSIRAIRHSFSTGALYIGRNYFEANSTGLTTPLFGHISPTINVVNEPNYGGSIKNVKADILLESNATGNIAIRSGKVVIDHNEASGSAPVLVAMVNAGGVTIKESRSLHSIGFFQIPTGQTINPTIGNIYLASNEVLSTTEPEFINMPQKYIYLKNGNTVNIGDFATSGYQWLGSITPEEDLAGVPDKTHYLAFANSVTGYPQAAGSITGYKSSANDYKYSWQTYVGPNGNITYRRYALSSISWSTWEPIGTTIESGTTAQRPLSPRQGRTFFNTTLNTIETWNGTVWRNSNPKPSYLNITTNATITFSYDDMFIEKTALGAITSGLNSSPLILTGGRITFRNNSIANWTLIPAVGVVTINGVSDPIILGPNAEMEIQCVSTNTYRIVRSK